MPQKSRLICKLKPRTVLYKYNPGVSVELVHMYTQYTSTDRLVISAELEPASVIKYVNEKDRNVSRSSLSLSLVWSAFLAFPLGKYFTLLVWRGAASEIFEDHSVKWITFNSEILFRLLPYNSFSLFFIFFTSEIHGKSAGKFLAFFLYTKDK